jgi:hypothetical protein
LTKSIKIIIILLPSQLLFIALAVPLSCKNGLGTSFRKTKTNKRGGIIVDKLDKSKIQEEVDANYEFFKTQLPQMIVTHLGQYVLLKNKTVIDYFDTLDDAQKYAETLYKDGLYSIQKVESTVLNLGFVGIQYA